MSEDYVDKAFCDERFSRILEMFTTIDVKLDKWILERTIDMKQNALDKKDNWKTYRSLVFAIVGGAIVAGLNYLLQHI